MKIAIKEGQVLLADVKPEVYEKIKERGVMKYDKRQQLLYGDATIDLLTFLATLFPLPGPAEDLKNDMIARQQAINDLRMDADPQPLIDYPVKRALYRHQVRGANMALIALGLVEPQRKRGD